MFPRAQIMAQKSRPQTQSQTQNHICCTSQKSTHLISTHLILIPLFISNAHKYFTINFKSNRNPTSNISYNYRLPKSTTKSPPPPSALPSARKRQQKVLIMEAKAKDLVDYYRDWKRKRLLHIASRGRKA